MDDCFEHSNHNENIMCTNWKVSIISIMEVLLVKMTEVAEMAKLTCLIKEAETTFISD